MTPGLQADRSWMWHPCFSEERKDTAGLFVHFKRTLHLQHRTPSSLPLHITADTRYKFYVNEQQVSFGPVKGDEHLWFYDEVDIASFLRPGENRLAVVVLRYFYGTPYTPSFPRLPQGGLRVVTADPDSPWAHLFRGGDAWETAIDTKTSLRVDEKEDDFLHVYERVARGQHPESRTTTWQWVPAISLEFRVSTGNSPPWHLSPRLIPPMTGARVYFQEIHNIRSTVSQEEWRSTLLQQACIDSPPPRAYSARGLRLPANSSHGLELEAVEHLTAFIRLRFKRPASPGGKVIVTYSESYEDEPPMAPYLRSKKHRQDYTKSLYGPKDIYELEGPKSPGSPIVLENDAEEEVLAPFHWRTFRFIQLSIETGPSELVLLGIDIQTANYPLEVKGHIQVPNQKNQDDLPEKLFATSIRTLKNCMHDCYEDCPFYEQLQYAMDSRNSILFTYYASGDDRLAKQAMIQIHNSFRTSLGLTCSRAPAHRRQVIPPFSLYWILMLNDHLTYFNDRRFIRGFMAAVDGVLNHFDSQIDPELGLTVSASGPGVWNFVDWAEQWRPYGMPPSAEKTGISTYINQLYAYALKAAAAMNASLGRASLAEEYVSRANKTIRAVREHCFDGQFFTDSLASQADRSRDYSQHSQVWAVLCGAVSSQEQGRELLRRCLRDDDDDAGFRFTPTSVSMSFYTLRALSAVGATVYDEHFHRFWEPWRKQLQLGVTTWEEDSVSQRSDCHAWGSAPIYEYLAEVAGIRPLRAGWSVVSFQPRTGLYPSFSARVPMGAGGGALLGVAHVSWEPGPLSGFTRVSLKFDMVKEGAFPVYVSLPNTPPRLLETTGDDLVFSVRDGL